MAHTSLAMKTKTQKEADAIRADCIRYNAEIAKNKPLFDSVANPENWKMPTKPKTCASAEEAQALADAITFYCGGAEISGTTVTSQGYYFYIGA